MIALPNVLTKVTIIVILTLRELEPARILVEFLLRRTEESLEFITVSMELRASVLKQIPCRVRNILN